MTRSKTGIDHDRSDVALRLEATLDEMESQLKSHTLRAVVLINVPSIIAAAGIAFAAACLS